MRIEFEEIISISWLKFDLIWKSFRIVMPLLIRLLLHKFLFQKCVYGLQLRTFKVIILSKLRSSNVLENVAVKMKNWIIFIEYFNADALLSLMRIFYILGQLYRQILSSFILCWLNNSDSKHKLQIRFLIWRLIHHWVLWLHT